MSDTIRTLLVDDEPLAREGLRLRLARETDIEVVGEAADGPAAIDAILALRPDLLFLDVQMPGLDGFDVLSRTADTFLPIVVFVTAYDSYAVRAFVVHALDYLLKPIAHRRLQEALGRVRRERDRDASEAYLERVRVLLDSRDSGASRRYRPSPEERGDDAARDASGGYASRFTVRDGERFVLIRATAVDWIEAAANYVRLHAGQRALPLRTPIGDLERRLDPAQFTRVHRSAIVNLDRIREIKPESYGEYSVVLTTGESLRLGRSYRGRLLG
jgi:two-component system LytT family response regulator